VAELACFLPKWLKSIDVVDRVISNGGTCGTIARMINMYREMGDAPTTSNSVLRMMMPAMRKRGGEFENWTVGGHIIQDAHDPSSLSISRFRIPKETHKDRSKSDPSVPFKDLAQNVKVFPQKYDALDLTRCVEYHVQPEHQDEVWNFPDDFEALVKHLGGPTAITKKYQDKEIFNRWTPPHIRKSAT
ncbi:hypothetical protein K458DRAFT_240589, partial [Lentithecium fluviatile CBS 122367]